MYTYWIITIIFTLIISYFFNKDFDEGMFYSDGIFVGFLYSILISWIPVLFITACINPEFEYYIESDIPIVALQDNMTSQGSFFLGSSSIDGQMKYVYLAKNEDGAVMKSIDAYDITIVETNETPKIITYGTRFKNPKYNHWVWNLHLGKTKIYIPKNSIKYNYNIDLN